MKYFKGKDVGSYTGVTTTTTEVLRSGKRWDVIFTQSTLKFKDNF
jgi:hypothetical protein